MPRSRPVRTSCTTSSRPNASSTPSSSPSPRWRCRSRKVTAARVFRRPGGVGRPRPDRLGARGRRRAGDRRAGVERRRVRRQGGHEQPGADRARGPVAGPTGEMHALARGIAARAPQAPSGAHRPRGRVRRRRPPHRAAGPHARRFGPLRLGRDEGAGTGGRARLRPVPGSRGRRRSGGRAHQQLGVRRVPRVRGQPGAVRDGGCARPPRRVRRHQRLGDPRPQRGGTGRPVGPGPGDGRRLSRRAPLPRSGQTRLRSRAGCRAGGAASASGSRTPASATDSSRSCARWCASSPTAPSRCGTAGPRWARACTRSPRRSRSRSSASSRSGSGWSSTRRASSARARPPGAAAR